MTEITLRKSAIDTISANTLDENSGLRVQVKENDLLTDLQSANLLTNQQLITVQFADLANLDLPDFTTVFVSDIGCNSLNTPGGSLWYTKGNLWYPVGGQVTNYYLANSLSSTPNTPLEIIIFFDLPAYFFREGAVITIKHAYEMIGTQGADEDLRMFLLMGNVSQYQYGIHNVEWEGDVNTKKIYSAVIDVFLAGESFNSLRARLIETYPDVVSTWEIVDLEELISKSSPIRISFKVENTATENSGLSIVLRHFEITTRFF